MLNEVQKHLIAVLKDNETICQECLVVIEKLTKMLSVLLFCHGLLVLKHRLGANKSLYLETNPNN